MGQGRAELVDPRAAPRRVVVVAVLAVLAMATVWFVDAWIGVTESSGNTTRRSTLSGQPSEDADAGRAERRRRARRSRALATLIDAAGPGAHESGASIHLGRAALILLLETSESPSVRADMIALLGATKDPENVAILEDYAGRGAWTEDGYAAQAALLRYFPESWPARAAVEYALLAGDGTHARFTRSYERVQRRRPPAWSWSKLQVGWGSAAWDPRDERYTPTASAADWRAFLESYPGFMGADDATWHLARAMHAEGEPPLRVVLTLNRAFSEPDGDAGRLLWAGLRHYLLERAPESVLRTVARSRRVTPQARYAAHYAIGLRHLWRLELSAAAETWSTLPEVSDHWPAGRSLRWRDGAPLRRWALCQPLIRLEEAWRDVRSRAGEAEAFLDLAEAIVQADVELGRWRGFFEPWLLVDTELDHPTEDFLEPELERIWRRSGGAGRQEAVRGRVEALRERMARGR